jgi:C-terminal processing protease CtpA/Prc
VLAELSWQRAARAAFTTAGVAACTIWLALWLTAWSLLEPSQLPPGNASVVFAAIAWIPGWLGLRSGRYGHALLLLGVVFAVATVLVSHFEIPYYGRDFIAFSRRRIWTVVAVVGLCAGIAMLAHAGRRRLATRWRRGGMVALAGLAAGVTIWAGARLRDVGLLPLVRDSREHAYYQLLDTLDRYYAQWETAPVTVDELHRRFDEQAEQVAESCGWRWEACPAYEALIRDLVAALQDGHTRVEPAPRRADPGIRLGPVAGQAVVVEVAGGSAAAERGVVPGMIVETIDGKTPAELLDSAPASATAMRSPYARLLRAYEWLLSGPAGSETKLRLRGADDRPLEVRLARWREGPTATLTWLRSGRLGYVHLSRASPDARAAFDAALAELADSDGMVLDLRGNQGGDSEVAEQIAGRFVRQRYRYGGECFHGHPLRPFEDCSSLWVEPRGPRYTKPLAVLIDGRVVSSGERLTAALCFSGAARCFGTTTAGDSGNPVPFFMPGLIVMLSAGETWTADGGRISGVGIEPHCRAPDTVESLRAGEDAARALAEQWLRTGVLPAGCSQP